MTRGRAIILGRRNCSSCKRWRLTIDFVRDANSGAGIRPICKPCWRKYMRVRYGRGNGDCRLPAHPLRDEIMRRPLSELARDSGVSERTLSRIRNSQMSVMQGTADKILVVIGKRFDELWPSMFA